MKFTIEGLNQAVLVSMDLDAVDAVLIRWFADFFLGAGMAKVRHHGKEYGWLRYRYAIEELPCLKIGTPRALSARFSKYVDKGLMEQYVRKDHDGTFTYFRLVPRRWDELSKVAQEAKSTCKPLVAQEAKQRSPQEAKQHPKIHLLSDPKEGGVTYPDDSDALFPELAAEDELFPELQEESAHAR